MKKPMKQNYYKKDLNLRENSLFYLELIELKCPKKKALSLALRKKDINQQKPQILSFSKSND